MRCTWARARKAGTRRCSSASTRSAPWRRPFIFGRISDRSGRRKIYVIAATIVTTISAVLLALLPNFNAAMLAALILGLNYGMCLAVDQALVTQGAADRDRPRARPRRVINIANSAPHLRR